MSEDFSGGAAYVDGRFVPLDKATFLDHRLGLPALRRDLRRRFVWRGLFFRLDDHIARFRRSMNALRLSPAETDDDIRRILDRCVRLSGLREAYVAFDCVRGRPIVGKPVSSGAYPQLRDCVRAALGRSLFTRDSGTRRASDCCEGATDPAVSIDPTVKNFHRGDLTRALFEAHDADADWCGPGRPRRLCYRRSRLQHLLRHRRRSGDAGSRWCSSASPANR